MNVRGRITFNLNLRKGHYPLARIVNLKNLYVHHLEKKKSTKKFLYRCMFRRKTSLYVSSARKRCPNVKKMLE